MSSPEVQLSLSLSSLSSSFSPSLIGIDGGSGERKASQEVGTTVGQVKVGMLWSKLATVGGEA